MTNVVRIICVCVVLAITSPAWAETTPVSETNYPGVTEAQKVLGDFYNELLQIKQEQEFVEKGFAPGFKAGNAWMRGVMAARDKASDTKLPYIIQDGYSALINLGTDYMDMRRKPMRDLMDLNAREEQIWNNRMNVHDALRLEIIP